MMTLLWIYTGFKVLELVLLILILKDVRQIKKQVGIAQSG
jgi:hypothetical protein